MNTATKSLLVVSAALLSASSAFAEISCPQFVPVPFSALETKIVPSEGTTIQGLKIDCAKVGLAANMIFDIKKMLAPDLQTPKQIIFRMVDTFDNAYFRPSEGSLNVPYQLMFGKYSKNPVFTVPVWAHEYGHSVFNHNLASAKEAWMKRLTPLLGDPKVAEALIRAFTGPYNEFFADVVAVLYTGKGDAVARGLFLTGYVANPEGSPKDCPATQPNCRPSNASDKVMAGMVIPRDFTARENQLSRWKPVSAKNIHNLLAPTRYDIWKYYISNPLYRNQKDRIAGLTLDAIIGDVSRRLNRMIKASGTTITNEAVDAEMRDTRRVNAEFIKTLDGYLSSGLRK